MRKALEKTARDTGMRIALCHPFFAYQSSQFVILRWHIGFLYSAAKRQDFAPIPETAPP
ncbi:hypothetical protein PUN4_660070 [Paraburkholderia unamae]|nr:hypothetical protein PUN4_660070 [Paraburkholderia unamae]